MAANPTCLVCQKEMELGFMTDFSHGNQVVLPRWCPGKPEPGPMSRFFGSEATGSQAEAGLKVVAYRCPQCEALRLYAPSAQ